MQVPRRRGENIPQNPRDYHLSPEKYHALEERLKRLKSRHPLEATEVKRLAEMGDFSENAGYQLAKGRLRGLNRRIEELEDLLKKAEIIVPDKDTSVIKVGHLVTISSNGTEKTYRLLGAEETDPDKGVISLLSPLGAALLGKRIGEKAVIEINGRRKEYQVIRISA